MLHLFHPLQHTLRTAARDNLHQFYKVSCITLVNCLNNAQNFPYHASDDILVQPGPPQYCHMPAPPCHLGPVLVQPHPGQPGQRLPHHFNQVTGEHILYISNVINV